MQDFTRIDLIRVRDSLNFDFRRIGPILSSFFCICLDCLWFSLILTALPRVDKQRDAILLPTSNQRKNFEVCRHYLAKLSARVKRDSCSID